MTFEIIKNIQNENQPYHVNQVARNGEVLNTTETLSSVDDCLKNIKSVCKGLGATKKIKIKKLDYDNGEKVSSLYTYIQDGKILKPWHEL